MVQRRGAAKRRAETEKEFNGNSVGHYVFVKLCLVRCYSHVFHKVRAALLMHTSHRRLPCAGVLKTSLFDVDPSGRSKRPFRRKAHNGTHVPLWHVTESGFVAFFRTRKSKILCLSSGETSTWYRSGVGPISSSSRPQCQAGGDGSFTGDAVASHSSRITWTFFAGTTKLSGL